MKKAILILLVGLFWCNVGFAKTIVYSKCNIKFDFWKDDTQLDEFINSEIRIDTNNKLINISKASESPEPIPKDQASDISEFEIEGMTIKIYVDTSIDKIWDIVNENDFIEANIKNDEIHALNRVKRPGTYVLFPHILTPKNIKNISGFYSFSNNRAHLTFSRRLVVNTTTNEIKIYRVKTEIPTERINFPRDFVLTQGIICDERLDLK